MTPKWKRGDLVRTTARLMFGRTVIPQGTQIRIQGHFSFFEELAYEGNVVEPVGDSGMFLQSVHQCYPLWPEDLEDVT